MFLVSGQVLYCMAGFLPTAITKTKAALRTLRNRHPTISGFKTLDGIFSLN